MNESFSWHFMTLYDEKMSYLCHHAQSLFRIHFKVTFQTKFYVEIILGLRQVEAVKNI